MPQRCQDGVTKGHTIDAYAGELADVPAPRWHRGVRGERDVLNALLENNARPPKIRRMTSAEVSMAKRTQACAQCKRFGHWYAEHNADGSLPSHIRSERNPIAEGGGLRDDGVVRSVPSAPPPPPPAMMAARTTGNQIQAPNRSAGSETLASSKPNSVTFNMADLVCGRAGPSSRAVGIVDQHEEVAVIGPMIDCGAPYSAIGFNELCTLAPRIHPLWDGSLLPLPSPFATNTKWQYGSGEHASAARDILGSVMLTASIDGAQASIRHLVLDGSSQWVIGRNVTSRCNILMMNRQRLELPTENGANMYVPIIQHAFHLYLGLSWFTDNEHDYDTLWAFGAEAVATQWCNLRKMIDRVHKHVCGHAAFSDIRTLLSRNSLWNDRAANYLATKMSECSSCRVTSEPQLSRRVSLSSCSRHFNDVVCIDHVHLEGIACLHIMDSRTRYSAGGVCENLSMAVALRIFEVAWMAPFWPPHAIQGDAAFGMGVFAAMMNERGIQWRPTPPGRHSLLVLESKHKILRAIFLRVANDESDKHLVAGRVFSISNDLYGSSIMSSYELAHGFTRPLREGPRLIPQEIINAQQCLEAKRKLARILRSRTTHDQCPQPGDLVEPFVKRNMDKRGKWLSSRTVLSFDRSAWAVVLPASEGRTMTVAIEDIRPAILPCEEVFANAIREANDALDNELDDIAIGGRSSTSQDVPIRALMKRTEEASMSENVSDFNPDYSSDGQVVTWKRIEVLWPLDGSYYQGRIDAVNDGIYRVVYDDGDIENLRLSEETWRFCSAEMIVGAVKSTLPSILKEMLDSFGNKPFLRHQAARFPQFALVAAYEREEADFKKTVDTVALHRVPRDANVITSHVLYKVKVGDDHGLKLKARIAPHGKEDAFKADLKSDCSQCPPYGVRMLLSFAALRGWRLSKVDVKAAFLQTGPAERDVFVVPPRESADRGKVVWLLMAAAYGLINANAKWQVHSDALLLQNGFERAALCPQLFLRKYERGLTTMMLAKIVDDILLTGPSDMVDNVIQTIDKISLGRGWTWPGTPQVLWPEHMPIQRYVFVHRRR